MKVVNEVGGCGLPVITTNAAGCSKDLISGNGIIVKNGDITELSFAIDNIIKEKKDIFLWRKFKKRLYVVGHIKKV